MKVWITRDEEDCYDGCFVKIWRYEPKHIVDSWFHGDLPLFKLKVMAFDEEFGFCPEPDTIQEKDLGFI